MKLKYIKIQMKIYSKCNFETMLMTIDGVFLFRVNWTWPYLAWLYVNHLFIEQMRNYKTIFWQLILLKWIQNVTNLIMACAEIKILRFNNFVKFVYAIDVNNIRNDWRLYVFLFVLRMFDSNSEVFTILGIDVWWRLCRGILLNTCWQHELVV